MRQILDLNKTWYIGPAQKHGLLNRHETYPNMPTRDTEYKFVPKRQLTHYAQIGFIY